MFKNSMKLNTYEKQSLRRFVGLYLGSSFVLIVFIALLFLHNAKSIFLESTEARLQSQSNQLTQDIIQAHMHHLDEPFKTLAHKYSHVHFVLLDAAKHVLYNHDFGDATSLAFFGKDGPFPVFLDQDNAFYLVDNKTFGHLGVDLVILEEEHPTHLFTALYRRVFLVFLGVFACVGVLSFFLAHLFLQPLASERSRINTFSQNIAHELNTPIAALLIAAKALYKQTNDPKILGILASAKRISHLYERLAYLYFQELRQEEPRLLDLKSLVAQQITALEQMAHFYHVSLSSQLESKTFKACEEDIATLVSNLLMNALKYNHPGGFVKVLLKDCLEVSNGGAAIPESKIKALTERYSRLDYDKKGYGIGLDLVQQICVRYGFSLEIESQPTDDPHIFCNVFRVYFNS
ncbi:Signal-transducing protein, histidine kinase CrdS [Helicobacter sp. NHP19-012]|uniref:histidine kinase n=1 Tax=Helicobacter gastrofelis TaxID=2849642 RepID=A0ABM7SIS0_9HELI|nr:MULTISPECIES: HAMP domain-containing sensor histidine kinase [unclassified Helicobacter]BCZ19869.1 Signal-transducing protein, histidine kinase CrdS [Helicobacter sp. NHP19-012]GMB95540.1 Signal-transducing protein, histidine kinase CrdS [Helicobacter sp. NHP22-001]